MRKDMHLHLSYVCASARQLYLQCIIDATALYVSAAVQVYSKTPIPRAIAHLTFSYCVVLVALVTSFAPLGNLYLPRAIDQKRRD